MARHSPKWLKYEKTIFEYLRLDHPDVEVLHNVSLPGRLSGIPRQIDVLVTEQLSGTAYTTAFEAKHYTRKVDVKGVEQAIGLFRDVGVDRGVMVTTMGYSAAAFQRASADDVDIDLDIFDLASLKPFQTDGLAIPYRGPHGIAIPAPLGWVVDGSKSPWGLARLYRRGQTFQQAHDESEFMYVQIKSKDSATRTLDELITAQNTGMTHHFQNAEITAEALDLGARCKGALRITGNMYPALEVTAFAEFEEFFLFIVLLTPRVVLNRNRRKLEYVMRKALPFSVTYASGGNANDNAV